jgi:hypothetical protein
VDNEQINFFAVQNIFVIALVATGSASRVNGDDLCGANMYEYLNGKLQPLTKATFMNQLI